MRWVDVSAALKAMRKAKGWSQDDLAILSGVSKATISRAETLTGSGDADNIPRLDNLERLLRTLQGEQASVGRFLTAFENPPTAEPPLHENRDARTSAVTPPWQTDSSLTGRGEFHAEGDGSRSSADLAPPDLAPRDLQLLQRIAFAILRLTRAPLPPEPPDDTGDEEP